MITFKTGDGWGDVTNFQTLKKFDGRTIQGDINDRHSYSTVLPISPLQHRQTESYKNRHPEGPHVRFWKGETHSEFVVADDWDCTHQLLIPNELDDIIDQCKRSVKESDIPCNF